MAGFFATPTNGTTVIPLHPHRLENQADDLGNRDCNQRHLREAMDIGDDVQELLIPNERHNHGD